jgi:hypothetical protein
MQLATSPLSRTRSNAGLAGPLLPPQPLKGLYLSTMVNFMIYLICRSMHALSAMDVEGAGWSKPMNMASKMALERLKSTPIVMLALTQHAPAM